MSTTGIYLHVHMHVSHTYAAHVSQYNKLQSFSLSFILSIFALLWKSQKKNLVIFKLLKSYHFGCLCCSMLQTIILLLLEMPYQNTLCMYEILKQLKKNPYNWPLVFPSKFTISSYSLGFDLVSLSLKRIFQYFL